MCLGDRFCGFDPSWLPGFQIQPLFLFFEPVVDWGRWQMIAGESRVCGIRQRKVRTPYGSMPRKTRGQRSPKRALTESVTEKTPPVLWQRSAGKVEKAR